MLNTMLRTSANNNFDKNLYKLMNKSFYGKTVENKRKHRDIRLSFDDNKIQKLVVEPNYHDSKYFDEIYAIEMKKTNILMNKPIYVGISIFEISKTRMYEYFYGYLKEKYGDKIKLYYTDTDSYLFMVFTEDFDRDCVNDIDKLYNTSELTVFKQTYACWKKKSAW